MPPLEEIKPLLACAWTQRELMKAMQAKADGYAARIKKGETLQAVAASAGSSVSEVPGIDRRNASQNQTLSQDPPAKLFTSRPGDVFTAENNHFGFVVGKLEAVHAGDTTQLAQMVEQLRPQMTQGFVREIGESAHVYARQKIKVTIDASCVCEAIGLEPIDPVAAGGKPVAGNPVRAAGEMTVEPAYPASSRAGRGCPQLVWTRLIDDLETPVSACPKIGHGRPYAFLFESVEGGRLPRAAFDHRLVRPSSGAAGARSGRGGGGRDIARGPFHAAGRRSTAFATWVAASKIERPEHLAAAVGRSVRGHRLRHDPAGRALAEHQSRSAGPAGRGDDPAFDRGDLRRHRPGDHPGDAGSAGWKLGSGRLRRRPGAHSRDQGRPQEARAAAEGGWRA